MLSPAHRKALNAEFEEGLRRQNAGKLAEAEASYNAVLDLDHRHVTALHNRALIRSARKQHGAAVAYLNFAAEIDPDFPETWNTLGSVWKTLGRRDEAERCYRKSIGCGRPLPLAHFNLGNHLAEENKLDEAEASYRAALAGKPDYAEARLNLTNVLRQRKRLEEALSELQTLIASAPNYDLAHNNIANIWRDMDQLEKAADGYQRAVEINPQYTQAWLNLGTVLNHLGRAAGSEVALRQALRIAPRFGEAFMHLVQVSTIPLDDALVADMRRSFDDPATSQEDRMYIAFGLGSLFDRNGQYDAAFFHFAEGNRLKRATLKFDIAGEKALVSRIATTFSPAYFKNSKPVAISDDAPIFIVGMMRSGTTLMEQILASHPQVAGADELPWMPEIAFGLRKDGKLYPESIPLLNQHELARAGEEYLAKLRKRFGPSPRFITDKLPGNFLNIGLISRILPRARIIHMQRNAYDTCLSIYFNLFASLHHYAFDLGELGEFYVSYRELMAHWDTVLPGKIYHQRYEDLVHDPETEIRKVLAFCELPFDPRCLESHETKRRVRTASSQQVRQKMHGRSVERWRNYERHLGVLKTKLGALT